MNDRSLADSGLPLRPPIERLATPYLGSVQPQLPVEAETLDLVEYWRSISKRKWSILYSCPSRDTKKVLWRQLLEPILIKIFEEI